MREIKSETLAARGGLAADGEVHPVVPPILPRTTYIRDQNYALPAGQAPYIRGVDPGALPAEHLLAQLEQGSAAALFASGTCWVMSLFSVSLGASRACADFRESTAVSRLNTAARLYGGGRYQRR